MIWESFFLGEWKLMRNRSAAPFETRERRKGGGGSFNIFFGCAKPVILDALTFEISNIPSCPFRPMVSSIPSYCFAGRFISARSYSWSSIHFIPMMMPLHRQLDQPPPETTLALWWAAIVFEVCFGWLVCMGHIPSDAKKVFPFRHQCTRTDNSRHRISQWSQRQNNERWR